MLVCMGMAPGDLGAPALTAVLLISVPGRHMDSAGSGPGSLQDAPTFAKLHAAELAVRKNVGGLRDIVFLAILCCQDHLISLCLIFRRFPLAAPQEGSFAREIYR